MQGKNKTLYQKRFCIRVIGRKQERGQNTHRTAWHWAIPALGRAHTLGPGLVLGQIAVEKVAIPKTTIKCPHLYWSSVF